MKLEVGEYIRTKKGIIGKVEHTLGSCKFRTTTGHISTSQNHYYIDNPKQRGSISEGVIVKHSFNIIDLIEVGDYVNGYEVMNIYKPRDIWEPIEIEIDSKCTRCFLEGEIKTILTHEQFEQNSYKIGE